MAVEAELGGSSTPSGSDGGAAAAGGSETAASSSTKVGQENRDSCIPKFDALWFCYSPGYQMQQYYIHGKVDDCSSKWTEFVDCLKKRTKFRDAVLQAEAEKRHPLWDIRTHEEAQGFWRREFGHLGGEARQAGDEADGAQHRGRATLV